MVLMRELEDRVELKLYRQGKIAGGCYTGRGQEAIPAGSAMVAEPDDYFCPSHRDLAAYLIRGITPREMLAQYLGRLGSPTNGRDGNMHIGSHKRKILTIISSIASNVPVAGGIALSIKYRGEPHVVFNYWGEGATSRGDWHEGVNFAAVAKTPDRLHVQQQPLCLLDPARATDGDRERSRPRRWLQHSSRKSWTGNDVIAVYEATKRAAAYAREGHGPYMIECKTFRVSGHSAHDSADYVPRELREEWSRRDPILKLQKYMVERGWSTEQDFKEVRTRVLAEIDDAVEWGLKQPLPRSEHPGTERLREDLATRLAV